MKGKIIITRTGYDPEKGKHVKDPYLGNPPSFGACRPDVRARLNVGDHIFVVSGKIRNTDQYVIGGLEVAEKINAVDAYRRFPEQRLHLREDGQIDGNVIVNSRGRQHALDQHPSEPHKIVRRLKNYIVGTNPIVLSLPDEVHKARTQTLEFLRDLLNRPGKSVKDVLSRFGTDLTEEQVHRLRAWLSSLRRTH